MFFFQAEDGIRDLVRSRGLGDVYKRQLLGSTVSSQVAAKQNQKSSTVSQTKALESTALILSLIHI